MELNVTEIPNKWVIIKLPNNYYKVFGTWEGGHLDGDRWKINSGIERVEQDNDYCYFIGFSGSCYKCHKNSYGITTSIGVGILNDIIESGKGQIELMKENNNWINLING